MEKLRQNVEIAPLELVLSGVRGEAPVEESVAIRNNGDAAVDLRGVQITGAQAATFKVGGGPRFPLTLVPRAQVVLTVTFSAPADSEPGVHRAMLRVLAGLDGRDETPPVDLAALVLAGRKPADEPPLERVAEALGFALEAAGAGSGAGAGRVVRFQRARRSPVSVYPVARFSGGGGAVPYGFYTVSGNAPEPQPLAVIAGTQQQTLNPDLEPDGKTTFDPGERGFGLYLRPGGQRAAPLYSDDALNPAGGAAGRRAARIHALSSRAGGRIADAYLVAFETGNDTDEQDFVFVVWNVKPIE